MGMPVKFGVSAWACLLMALACGGCGNGGSSSSSPSQQSSKPASVIRFENVAQAAGLDYRWTPPGHSPLTILGTIGNGCAFLDYDNDGNLDVLLVGPRVALFKGDGHGHFTDVSHQMGLDKLHGHFLGCAVGDYDNDGYEDIYLSAYRGGALLHNDGGRGYSDVTKAAGIVAQPWGTSAAFVDVDGDGRPDLYIGNYVDFGPKTKMQLCETKSVMMACGVNVYKSLCGVLYRNLGNGKFADASKQWGVDKLTGPVLGVAPADYDFSGHQSIYLANDAKMGNLLHNDGHKFTDVGRASATASDADGKPQSGMGVDWGDFDSDGRLDLTVGTFSSESNSIYHNEGGGLFTERSANLGMYYSNIMFVKFGEKWLDANNSGWLDLMIASGHVMDNVARVFPTLHYREPTQLYTNYGGRRFTLDSDAMSGSAGAPIVGRGLAIGDYDNDGKIDALVVDSDGNPLLLHNVSTNTGHWLEINLIGTKSNRDGQGAIVILHAMGGKLVRQCTTAGSYLSASDRRVHVGLGPVTSVDSIDVHWPSGHVDSYTNIAGDRQITLKEGESAPESGK